MRAGPDPTRGFPRPLTVAERDVLTAMVQHADDPGGPAVTLSQRRRWLAQVPAIMVHGRCPCGTCPTIDLLAEVGSTSRRIVLGAAAEGMGLALFIDDDRLSRLEAFPLSDDGTVLAFPPASQLSM